MANMEFKGMGLVFLFFLCFLCGRCFSAVQDKIELINQENGSLNFLVIGDWGRKGSYNQSEVAYQLGRIGEELQVEFIVSTGDNFYEDGLTNVTDKSFGESFSDIYTAKSLQKPWYAVLGNHDYRGDVLAQLSPILRSLDHRWNCRRSFTLRRSFTAGSVDLFFVDTTPFVAKYWKIPNEHTYDWRGVAPKEAYVNRQLKELAMGLEESNATWKIVIGHHTIRSVGHHGDTEELLQQLLPILETHNVDLYINGHDHCLEHIKSVTSDLQFFTSGGGSKSWRGIDNDANMEGLEMYYDGQGFLSLQITPTNIQAAFYDIEGIVIHQVELHKSDLKHLLQKY